MADDMRIAFEAIARKLAGMHDGDILREGVRMLAHALMEAEVETPGGDSIGAGAGAGTTIGAGTTGGATTGAGTTGTTTGAGGGVVVVVPPVFVGVVLSTKEIGAEIWTLPALSRATTLTS